MGSIKQVRKRDGRIVHFEIDKIIEAIFKAAQAVGGKDIKISEELANEVLALLEKKFIKQIPSVEDIQDAVEKVLIEKGHAKTAKAYILYRQQHKEMREAERLKIDTGSIVKDYMDKEDWRVHENANVAYSMAGLFLHSAGTVMSYYGINYIYPKEIAEAYKSGDFHIHDLSMSLNGYCAGWSLRQLLHEGFNGVPGKVECGPPKHLRTAVGQMINFIGTLQNEWAGAQAFSSFDTYLAPFIKEDKLKYDEVKQSIQEFVFNMNVSSRWGSQTPFTNVTMDLVTPPDLAKQQVTIGGKLKKETYADYVDEVEIINKAFLEVMTEGDAKGGVFTFPIPTYNLTKEMKWDSEMMNNLFDMTSKYGLPYFQNFINSDLKPTDIRAMCCRLRLNVKELMKNTGGRFGSGESTGSIGVVTINLPRIGYLSKNEGQFFERLDRIMYIARQSLEIKRKMVARNVERNLLPYTKRYLGNLNRHFSTIGILGMNECCQNFLNKDITTVEGQRFAIRVLKFMKEKLLEYQEETGNIYNLEATPAEGASYSLARKDKKAYPEIITAGKTAPYYTNSTQLPVNHTDDLFAALKHQEPLQKLYTGGTVFHTFLGESLNSGSECRTLIRKMASGFEIPYFTITPTFSICHDHGYIKGEQHKCPTCGKNAEVYSRVVGYLRPVTNWNPGKQDEYSQRKSYNAAAFSVSQ